MEYQGEFDARGTGRPTDQETTLKYLPAFLKMLLTQGPGSVMGKMSEGNYMPPQAQRAAQAALPQPPEMRDLEPTQMRAGALPAAPGRPVTSAPRAPVVAGAPRAPTAARQQPAAVGALPQERELVMNSTGMNPADAVAQPGAVAGPATAGQSLPELYKALMAQVNRNMNVELTPDQKAKGQRNYYANLGVAGGKPLSTMAGSMGAAELESQKYDDGQEAMNRVSEMARVGQERGEAANMVNLQDKESDNARADKTQASTEKQQRASEQHQRVLETLKERELKVNEDYRKALIAAKGDENERKTAELEHRTRLFEIREARLAAGTGGGGGPDANSRFLQTLKQMFPSETPDQIFNRFQGRSADPGRDDRAMRALYAKAEKDHGNNIMNFDKPMEPFEVWAQKHGGKGGSTSGSTAATVAKPDAAANKGRTIIGPDGRFKSDGKTWVSAK